METGGSGTDTRRADKDRRARLIFAAVGAAIALVMLFAFYVPGMAKDDNDLGLLLIFPAAALALPFALLALLLRVRIVWIACGLLMTFVAVSLGTDLFGGEDEGGVSLLVFFFMSLANFVIFGIALVADLALRGAKRVAKSLREDQAG